MSLSDGLKTDCLKPCCVSSRLKLLDSLERPVDETCKPMIPSGGTYLSRNFATLGPLPDSRRVNLNGMAVTSLCHVIQAKGMLEVKRLAVELRG